MARDDVFIHADLAAASRALAERWLALAQSAIERRGQFHVALTGGSTPRLLYRMLAEPPYAERVAWDKVHVYFGDERCVAPDHPDSNYRMARETLLARVAIPSGQIHRMAADAPDLEASARAYGECLARNLPREPEGGAGRLDLILLGLGEDGHVASLFPGTSILAVIDRPVAPVYVERLRAARLSVTFPVIDAARHVALLVAGAAKADIVGAVLGEAPSHAAYPVEMIAPKGRMEWFLDRAAAARLA